MYGWRKETPAIRGMGTATWSTPSLLLSRPPMQQGNGRGGASVEAGPRAPLAAIPTLGGLLNVLWRCLRQQFDSRIEPYCHLVTGALLSVSSHHLRHQPALNGKKATIRKLMTSRFFLSDAQPFTIFCAEQYVWEVE